MDTVTYPEEKVAGFINENYVAWRVDYNEATGLLRRHTVFWTPTLIFLDQKGGERYRLIGFLPPEILMVHLMLGRAMIAFTTRRYAQAVELFDRISREYPDSEEAPQAIYLRGVARYKATGGDDSFLYESAEELRGRFPSSEWTVRANIW